MLFILRLRWKSQFLLYQGAFTMALSNYSAISGWLVDCYDLYKSTGVFRMFRLALKLVCKEELCYILIEKCPPYSCSVYSVLLFFDVFCSAALCQASYRGMWLRMVSRSRLKHWVILGLFYREINVNWLAFIQLHFRLSGQNKRHLVLTFDFLYMTR